MPELEKIRLNASKRQALKKEWLHTVYNNMHLQVDEDLKEAQRNFRSVRSDVWDKVITPIVEKNYPMADMKILIRIDVSFSSPLLLIYQKRNSNGQWVEMNLMHCIIMNCNQEVIRQQFELNMNKHKDKKTRTFISQLMICKKATGILLNQMALMKILHCITGQLIIES